MAKLLLVDDDEGPLVWMTDALEALGHEVRAFTADTSALRSVEDWRPDLIVTDILMPEMGGIAFARLARRHRKVPILFVSVAKKEAEAILVGASGYVQKPATAAEVRDAVERILGRGATKNTVLIVDDQMDARELYRAVLEPEFEVLEAGDGREALEVLRRAHVDLVLADVHMPVMNGVELIREMRSDEALMRIPVIVQTSDRTAREAPVWRALQVAHVIDKGEFVAWLDGQIRTRIEAAQQPVLSS